MNEVGGRDKPLLPAGQVPRWDYTPQRYGFSKRLLAEFDEGGWFF